MFLQSTGLGKRFWTLRAFVEFVTQMNFWMFLQISFLGKRFWTLGALIKFFNSVNSKMFLQVSFLGKRFWTLRAAEGFLFHACSELFLHVVWISIRFCANSTTKFYFSCSEIKINLSYQFSSPNKLVFKNHLKVAIHSLILASKIM